jgi:tRNA (guanine26-N2/guanine27-N2)-dimethyltransferase
MVIKKDNNKINDCNKINSNNDINKKCLKGKIVKEGLAEIYVYEGNVQKSDIVFYNSVMKFNRDLSVFALKSFVDLFDKDDVVVVDGLSASGLRGIRYLKECDSVKFVVFNDLNPNAYDLIKNNLKLNEISDVCGSVFNDNINKLLYDFNSKIDFIDIDPFGSPIYFVDSSGSNISSNSLFGVTATDTAALCGTSSRACLRKYDAKPLRVDFKHEIGLRILIGSIVRRFAVFEKGFVPLLCFSKDHYFRVMGRIDKGTLKSDESLKNIGYIFYCSKCGDRGYIKSCNLDKCSCCSNKLSYAGPLWIGLIGNFSFVDKMRSFCLSKKELNFLDILLSECSCEGMVYDIHMFCKLNKILFGKIDDIIVGLIELGFFACKTHYSGTAIRTNAKSSDLIKVILDNNKK